MNVINVHGEKVKILDLTSKVVHTFQYINASLHLLTTYSSLNMTLECLLIMQLKMSNRRDVDVISCRDNQDSCACD